MKYTITALILILAVCVCFQAAVLPVQAKTPKPLSSPLTYFKLQGHILFKGKNRLIPAENIMVEAINQETKQLFKTATNEDGHYEFSLQNNTTYIVIPHATHGEFTPSQQAIYLTKNTFHIQFIGQK